ncbi:DUF4111 domain-containing protein [Iamia sp. SCSIO 61187]|uniref:aminoglycoside adenylyltransferase domain-containing protein n=1 Tax=Iamia sp. SCSIO 61187 TaxID=2722752 RepID=UPI001C6293B5|nr:aminoglycoside adenylyltransferase domain-containing protein [Iamia sp. SCSIO 61187]QYG93679.1 DUF4111 domain-containing protein [Iamia sp. SCSIO 61187]
MAPPERSAIDHTPDRAQHWDDCDPDVRRWVEGIVSGVVEELPRPVGVYLHGSLAMGCYHRAHSDADLLVVVDVLPTERERRSLALRLLDVSEQRPTSAGLELSVVLRSAVEAPRHPVPYACHFSERWVADVRSGGAGPRGTDPDLAGHCAVTRHRGIALLGPEPTEVVGEVARRDLVASVLADVRDTLADGLVSTPVYGVLNACRTLHLLAHDPAPPLSKEEGGAWALAHLPPTHRPVVADALECYRSAAEVPADLRRTHGHRWDEEALLALAAFVRDSIRSAPGNRLPRGATGATVGPSPSGGGAA